jgi:hypothetical protein
MFSRMEPRTAASAAETDHAKQDALFGTIARERGYVADDQLLEALEMQVLVKRHFGHLRPVSEILFVRGAISVERLRSVLHEIGVPLDVTTRISARGLFGQLAVDRGYVKREDLLRCLDLQALDVTSGKRPRPLGEVMVGEGLLTPKQVEELLRLQKREK